MLDSLGTISAPLPWDMFGIEAHQRSGASAEATPATQKSCALVHKGMLGPDSRTIDVLADESNVSRFSRPNFQDQPCAQRRILSKKMRKKSPHASRTGLILSGRYDEWCRLLNPPDFILPYLLACGAGLPGSPHAAKTSAYDSVERLDWRAFRNVPIFLCRMERRLRVTFVLEAISSPRIEARGVAVMRGSVNRPPSNRCAIYGLHAQVRRAPQTTRKNASKGRRGPVWHGARTRVAIGTRSENRAFDGA
jgi:hypothetical protein